MPTYSYIWQFQVAADRMADFERHYAAGGSWTDLFRLGHGYVGTELLKDRTDPLRYITIDTWQSIEAYQQFRATFGAQYRALDEVCAGFTTSEVSLGEFSGVSSNPSLERP
jgi:heme-degrading monooxygenase HmoA